MMMVFFDGNQKKRWMIELIDTPPNQKKAS